MKIQNKINISLLFFISLMTFASAEDLPSADQPLKSERINVEKIKERYWNKGEESELRVVQNRLYTKNKKLELSVFGATTSTDPFLKVYNVGASLGYHFSEYLSLNLTYWNFYVTPSSAAGAFQQQTGKTTNKNEPHNFKGTELEFSPIYGKLSFVGQSIIYYDLHLLLGAGLTDTESGNYITPLVGIGQQIFLSKSICLRLDYRLTYFNEKVLQKIDQTKLNSIVGTRDTFNSMVSLGFTYLFSI